MIPQPPYDKRTVYAIPLSAIYADHNFNCRGIIDPSEVRELAKDIAEKGLTQPVVVQPWKSGDKPEISFRLVAGYRRYAAHGMNKADAIDAVIRDGLSEADAVAINLTENLQRTDLNPLQEALALESLKDRGWGREKISKRISKSPGWVQERMYLLELPPEIQEAAASRVISLKEVRQIWSLPSEQQQYEYLRRVKDAKLAGKRKTIPKPESVKNRNEAKPRTRGEIFEIQEEIRKLFGHGLTTRALAWAAGEIDDAELHGAIAKEASLSGKFYAIPEGLHGRANDIKPDKIRRKDLDSDLQDLLVEDESDEVILHGR